MKWVCNGRLSLRIFEMFIGILILIHHHNISFLFHLFHNQPGTPAPTPAPFTAGPSVDPHLQENWEATRQDYKVRTEAWLKENCIELTRHRLIKPWFHFSWNTILTKHSQVSSIHTNGLTYVAIVISAHHFSAKGNTLIDWHSEHTRIFQPHHEQCLNPTVDIGLRTLQVWWISQWRLRADQTLL